MTEAVARLTQHAVVLRAGQAPHQQALAQDIEDVLKIVKDPAGEITAALSLLAGKDRHLMELTSQQGRNEETIRRISDEREQLRGAMNYAVAASKEAARHRDEAQKELEASDKRYGEVTAQNAQFAERILALESERDHLAKDLEAATAPKTGTGMGIASTDGESMADIKERTKGQGNKTKA